MTPELNRVCYSIVFKNPCIYSLFPQNDGNCWVYLSTILLLHAWLEWSNYNRLRLKYFSVSGSAKLSANTYISRIYDCIECGCRITNLGYYFQEWKCTFPGIINWTYFNSMWPSTAIWRHRPQLTLAQLMACCLAAPSHYLNQCWLIISDIRLRAISQEIPEPSIAKISLKITSKKSKISLKSPWGQWVKVDTSQLLLW